jgi:predicted HicB family RNase H-like nuclease
VQAELGLYTRNMVRVPSLTEDRAASYRISLARTGDGQDATWLALVDEMPDCTGRGATPAEAVQRALAAAEATTATAQAPTKADGQAQKPVAQHSGKLLVRMPATLHDELAQAAESEGVSLNQMITGILASAVEWRSDGRRGGRPEQPAHEDASSVRLTRIALAANVAAVLVAATVAITLLVVAWRAGF